MCRIAVTVHKYCIGILLVLTGLAGCGGSGDGSHEPVDVYAAASLGEVFPEIAPEARYSFAGSDELATQIREGAPADVYAAASSKYPQELYAEDLVEEPVTFASNRLVLIVPKANPAAIESPEDLLPEGTRLVLAAEGVPVGDYARDALAALSLSDALRNVVSNEDDVKGVAAKVALGEADAGIVYATDAAPLGDEVLAFELPDQAQPTIEYRVAVVSGTDDEDGAAAFVERLLSDDGRAALEAAGFVVPD
jgi:molybdate transport system substrate-binding protein